jgi:hypothetical protein
MTRPRLRNARAEESRCRLPTNLVRCCCAHRTSTLTIINPTWAPFLKLSRSDKRTNAWLKLKKDYVTGIGDSLDLIPIGAWHGNGRKVRQPARTCAFGTSARKTCALTITGLTGTVVESCPSSGLGPNCRHAGGCL